jgi:hypothetical protein
MRYDEETVQDAEGDCWDREEVHRCNCFAVVAQECCPSPGGTGVSRRFPHPSQDSALRDVQPEHLQLTVDPWRAPGWDGKAGVSLPDTIAFLRQNRMDKLVDGYAVHVYPTGDPRATVAARVAELDRKRIFSQCGGGAKPCWLTEWGISNASPSCPIDDAKRRQAIEAERNALAQFARQKKLAAAIYYTWDGVPPGSDPIGVFRCGVLTDAGKLALSPMWSE